MDVTLRPGDDHRKNLDGARTLAGTSCRTDRERDSAV